MRHPSWLVLLAALAVVAVVCMGALLDRPELGMTPGAVAAEDGPAKQDDKKKSGGPPPLVIDKGAPLLLDDPPPKDPYDAPEGPVADNGACYVCHTNYDEEPMAQWHARANVGCVECHGESLAHRNDEDNITPPDVMFPLDKIDAGCGDCHDGHDVSAAMVVQRWQERCPKKTDAKKIVCTDCHGQHRLKFRTVWWDKRTRKLIVRGKDERIKVADDPKQPSKNSPKDKAPGKVPDKPQAKPTKGDG